MSLPEADFPDTHCSSLLCPLHTQNLSPEPGRTSPLFATCLVWKLTSSDCGWNSSCPRHFQTCLLTRKSFLLWVCCVVVSLCSGSGTRALMSPVTADHRSQFSAQTECANEQQKLVGGWLTCSLDNVGRPRGGFVWTREAHGGGGAM